MAQESTTSKSSYRSVEHLCPSSVICETLFSDAKHIMSDVRSKMDPSTLEMILILKNNMDLWDARTIYMIINRDDAAVAGKNVVVTMTMLLVVYIKHLCRFRTLKSYFCFNFEHICCVNSR